MAVPLVPDDLWAAIAPLLPLEPPKPKGGRPRVPDRVALAGILFVLRTGIQWRDVPMEMGCSGKTCWRRLVEWHTAGVWAALHRTLLERLRGADRLDWSRASLDSASVRAKRGARRPGPIRRTAARRARSGTWSSMARARRSA
jgi:transposase